MWPQFAAMTDNRTNTIAFEHYMRHGQLPRRVPPPPESVEGHWRELLNERMQIDAHMGTMLTPSSRWLRDNDQAIRRTNNGQPLSPNQILMLHWILYAETEERGRERAQIRINTPLSAAEMPGNTLASIRNPEHADLSDIAAPTTPRQQPQLAQTGIAKPKSNYSVG